MTNRSLSIILVEDNDLDAELTAAALDDAGIHYSITRVQDPQAFEAELTGANHDLILSDYVLPRFSGMAALRLAQRHRPDLPFVFVSGVLGEELAIESIKGGASDYVLKQRLDRIGPSVRRAISEAAARRRGGERTNLAADRLAMAQQSARIGVFDADLAAGTVYWSAEQESIFGLKPGEFEGAMADWTRRIHPDDVTRLREEIALATAEYRPRIDLAYRISLSSGQTRWVEGSARFVYDIAGRAVRMVGLSIDVTDRRLAEEQNRRSAERERFLSDATKLLTSSLSFQAVAQGLSDISLPMMGDCCFVDAQDESGKLQQIAWSCVPSPRRDALSHATRQLSDGFGCESAVAVALRTGRPHELRGIPSLLEAQSQVAPDVRRAILDSGLTSVLAFPLSVGGRQVGAITFGIVSPDRFYSAEDIQLGEELASRAAIAVRNAWLFEAEHRARDEAETANRAKDQFLATVSHELRTPLNSIVGWVQLMRMGAIGPDETSDALGRVLAAADSQKQLIEDILDVSRIIHGQLKLDRAPVNMLDVMRAAIDAVRPLAVAKRIRLELQDSNDSLVVHGDAARLQQVLANLLNNAVKFTPTSGAVSIVARRQGTATVDVIVKDSGKGITPDFLPQVFERFRQADGSTTRRYGGLGIGLALARHVTELHGGTISASSEGEGRGATFTVSLPLDVAEPVASERLPIPDDDLPRLDGVSILVVDDDNDGREVVRALLAASGADVLSRSNAADALTAITLHQPRVLLSDIAMPDEDGYSLIRRVRELDMTIRQPVAIAMTAFASPEDRRRVLSMQFDHHITKPIESRELIHLIARHAEAAQVDSGQSDGQGLQNGPGRAPER